MAQDTFNLDISREVAQLGDVIEIRKNCDFAGLRQATETAAIELLAVITEKLKKQRLMYERTFIPNPVQDAWAATPGSNLSGK